METTSSTKVINARKDRSIRRDSSASNRRQRKTWQPLSFSESLISRGSECMVRAYGCHARCKATAGAEEDELQDQNQLQTALNTAIASEDYARASRLRDRLKSLLGDSGKSGLPADWQALGILEWLANRAERLGYRFPTGMPSVAPP